MINTTQLVISNLSAIIGIIGFIATVAVFGYIVQSLLRRNLTMTTKSATHVGHLEEKLDLLTQKVSMDIDTFHQENGRQQVLCANHNNALADISAKQTDQQLSQKYMVDLFKDFKQINSNTNEAIGNNTLVLKELLIVIREQSNGLIRK